MIHRLSQIFKRIRAEIYPEYKTAMMAGTLSGILIGTSWIPFPPWALIIGLSPILIFALQNLSSLRKIFWAGWFCQLFLTLIGFHWIAYVSHEFGFMPWPVAFLVLLLFASLMHIYLPLGLVVGAKISRKLELSPAITLVVMSGSLALFEQYWPSIFQWNFAYPLIWSGSAFSQLADVFGFAGLSWFVILLNGLFAYIYINRSLRQWLPAVVVAIFILGLGYFWGLHKKEKWTPTNAQINILLAQANIGNAEKLYAEQGKGYQLFIANEFLSLSRDALQKFPQTDLLIWPESAFPDFLNEFARNKPYPQMLFKFISETQKPLLTGAYSKDPPDRPIRDDYNGVFLFDQNQRLIEPPYHKTDLLIFGEYIPFGRERPWLAKLNPGGIGWGRGQGPQVWNLEVPSTQSFVKIGPQICYESLNAGFSRKLSRLGADILVNVTNDSWFGPNFEPLQHLYMTFARGLEVRRPMVRSTNTGISSVMLANGQVLEHSPLFKKWAGMYEVKYLKDAPLTFYARYGNFLPILIIFTMVVCIGIGVYLRK